VVVLVGQPAGNEADQLGGVNWLETHESRSAV
jgi:hypothetical protein